MQRLAVSQMQHHCVTVTRPIAILLRPVDWIECDDQLGIGRKESDVAVRFLGLNATLPK